MANVTIQIVGLDKSIKDMQRYVKRKHTELLGVVSHSSSNIKSEARQIVPVDTGNLRSSINYTIVDRKKIIEGEILADTDYAIYVEFGTRKMAAQPFMDPAYRTEKPKFINAVRRVMQAP